MQKFYTLTIAVLFFNLFVFAENVERSIAEKVAAHFLIQNTGLGEKDIQLSLVVEKEILRQDFVKKNGKSLLYIFNYNNAEGFVIVSGDNLTYPVLGYGTEGGFKPDDIAPGTRKWIEGCAQEIAFIKENRTETTAEIEDLWKKYIENIPDATNNSSRRAVNPLVVTKWNQAPYENALCPVNTQSGQRTVTGCVATAMAQIMKFWNYPTQGTGFRSYATQNYGTLSANFGSTTYQWNQMPNTLNSTNQAVSTLMFHCGVGVDMVYGTAAEGGSYAYVCVAASPTTVCAETAFKQYFGYDPATVRGVLKQSYTDANWIALLKTELDNGRPIDYAGIGGGGGHSWVCDGYDNNSFFHMNWGWGGSSDGYFNINNLDPSNLGAGGGTGGFNNNQQAVIGIKPINNGGGGGGGGTVNQANIKLSAAITVNSNPIQVGSQLQVFTQIQNAGSASFTGDFTAALFTEDGVFVDYVETFNSQTLQANLSYNATFTLSQLNVVPGTYFIGIFYKNVSSSYSLVDKGSFVNPVSITVTGPPNAISMYNNTTINPASPTPNQAFTITTQIANLGGFNFTGWLSADLFTLDGDFIQEISEFSATLDAGLFYNVQFNSNGLNVAPGEYLIAFFSTPNQNNYTLVSNQSFPNPIKIKIVGTALSPDIYEANNTDGTAYQLPLSFSGNQASITTSGSNNHVGNDYDYYKISLPAGNGYTISARIHDSYNSGNGQTYSTDAQFSYSINGGAFSESFDDVMPSAFTVPNGGTVTFFAAPFFTGQTGTYLLDINVTRGPVGLEETVDETVSFYPNPVSSNLFIQPAKVAGAYELNIFDAKGSLMQMKNDIISKDEVIKTDVAALPAGVYTVKLKTDKGSSFNKFIKQ